MPALEVELLDVLALWAAAVLAPAEFVAVELEEEALELAEDEDDDDELPPQAARSDATALPKTAVPEIVAARLNRPRRVIRAARARRATEAIEV